MLRKRDHLMRRFLPTLALLLVPSFAWAQGAVSKCGPATAGHIAMWSNGSCLVDGGGISAANTTPANTNLPGTLLSGVAIVNSAQGLALYSNYATSGFSALKLGFDASGNGLISLDSPLGQANKTVYLEKNGTLYELPGSGAGGGITGPASSVVGDLATWNSSTGTALRDPGIGPIQSISANSVLCNPNAFAAGLTACTGTGSLGRVVFSGGTPIFTGTPTVSTAADPTINLNTTANVGAGNRTGTLQVTGRNASNALVGYSNLDFYSRTVTAGAENGLISFLNLVGGAPTVDGQISGGWIVGNPTGSFKGVGTINIADSVWLDGVKTITAPGQFKGTATNDNAAAGYVGEYVTANVAPGSAISLTSTVAVDVTSISLTAGDWDVSCAANWAGGGTTTVGSLDAGLSTTSATIDTAQDRRVRKTYLNGTPWATAANDTTLIGPARFLLSGTTTVYCVAQATFGVSTQTVYGQIWARRVR